MPLLYGVDCDEGEGKSGETGLSAFGEAARPDRVSYWVSSADAPDHGTLETAVDTDVAVIGAGIVGLTTALLLAEAGRDVTVIEADRVAAGVSGYTTAKLTAGHGFIYSHLETLGDDAGRLYAESQLVAISAIAELCERHSIACDLELAANYVAVESEDELGSLDSEIEAAVRAGLPVKRVTDMGVIPFPAAGALVLYDQAQFHVRKYLLALARLTVQAGGKIFDHSRVIEIAGGGPYIVRTPAGSVRASAVVVATHYPIVEQGFFATRIHPRRSYVVAAPVKEEPPQGMFITTGSTSRSVRTVKLDDSRRLVLVGGEGHRVGQEETTGRYRSLELFMQQNLSVGDTMFRWSTQDNHAIDRLPYVGAIDESEQLYVATGFAGWGMSNGTAAALILSDAIQSRSNPWAGLYHPDRRHLVASARKFVTENVKIAAVEMKAAVTRHPATFHDIEPGGGAIVDVDGTDCAVSKDEAGGLHVVSASCTHMGCTVAWNETESSWDCPCHGSRFTADGDVLHGPALRPLEGMPSSSAVLRDDDS